MYLPYNRHDIIEIFLKVALNTIKPTNLWGCVRQVWLDPWGSSPVPSFKLIVRHYLVYGSKKSNTLKFHTNSLIFFL